MKINRSRLQRVQEKKSLKKAGLYSLFTLVLALFLLFLGIPALIRLAVFIGDLRSSGQPVEQEDKLPPSPPRLKPLPEATNSAQIIIEGFAEPGATVEIIFNGVSNQNIVVDADGFFSFGDLLLELGENEISALATDKAGNISQPSGRLNITFDNTPPELTISNPENNSRFNNPNDKVTIQGITEPEAEVTINGRLAFLSSDGSFQFPFNLSTGENKILIVAIDKAENKTEKDLTLTLE